MRKVLSLCLSLLAATAVCGQEKNIKVVNYVSGPQLQCFIDALGGAGRYNIDSLVISLLDFRPEYFPVLRDCCEHGRLTGIDMSGCHGITEIPSSIFMSSMVNAKPHGAVRTGEDIDLNMNLRYIKLPNTIKTIGSDAFKCTNLEQIELPAWIENIDFGAFVGCSRLQNVVLRGNKPHTSELCSNFSDLPSDAVLHVAEGLGDYYRNEKGWGIFGSVEEDVSMYRVIDVTLGSGMTLAEALGDNNMNVAKLIVNGEPSAADIELVKSNVQKGWLTDVDFSSCTIKDGNLIRCMMLSLCMPKVMANIPKEFLCKSEAVSFTMPESYDAIGYDAFEKFSGFADSTLFVPEGCHKIGYKAFENCRSLKILFLPSTMDELEPYSLHMNGGSNAVPNLDLYVNRMYPPVSSVTCPDLNTDFRNDDGPFGYATEEDFYYTQGWRLFVPVGAKQNYESDEHWSHIPTIIETPLLTGTTDGIREAVTTGAGLKTGTSSADGIYTIDGRMVTSDTSARTMPRGLYVVRSGGTARKVVMGR